MRHTNAPWRYCIRKGIDAYHNYDLTAVAPSIGMQAVYRSVGKTESGEMYTTVY